KGEATVATINEVKVGDTAVTSYAGQELKANALSLTHFAGTQNVSIPASGQVAIKTNLTAKTPNFAKVNLAYNDMSTVQPKLLIRGTSLFLDDSKDSQNYYIYLINTDKTNAISNLSLADLGLSLTIDNSNSFDELVQYDSTNSYYYVEMGTMPNETNTGSEYIKWRYISEDGQTKFINEEQPFSLKGTYILETDVQHLTNCAVNNPDCINNSKTLRNDDVANNMLLSVSYQNSYIKNWDNVTGYLTGENSSINANDYALSTIRQYINGTNVAKATSDTTSWKGFETITPKETSQNSNMLIDLCINADEDVVYNKISARSLKDLYSDMGEGLDNINYLTDTAYALGAGKVSNADTLTEKFWIPSFAEVKNLLATSDSYAPYQSEDAGADWNTSNMHGYYWLRSPRAVHSSDAYFVYYGGNCYYQSVNVYYCAARACFNLG
ncbi:MAG: hypothetical protein IJA69_03190, partial [Clostridia bacterium]|nr:hypothetical protein [Clostridia bacterium]